MPQPPPPPEDVPAGLADPGYWLVIALDWPAAAYGGAGAVAEAAAAIAPGIIPRDRLSHDAYQLLGCADLYARNRARRVVFLSDLTAMFASAGTSWASLGVHWQDAIRELLSGTYPAMYLAISERAWLAICDPATSHAPRRQDSQGAAGSDRELIRHAITRQLAAEWPACMRSMLAAGKVRLTG